MYSFLKSFYRINQFKDSKAQTKQKITNLFILLYKLQKYNKYSLIKILNILNNYKNKLSPVIDNTMVSQFSLLNKYRQYKYILFNLTNKECMKSFESAYFIFKNTAPQNKITGWNELKNITSNIYGLIKNTNYINKSNTANLLIFSQDMSNHILKLHKTRENLFNAGPYTYDIKIVDKLVYTLKEVKNNIFFNVSRITNNISKTLISTSGGHNNCLSKQKKTPDSVMKFCNNVVLFLTKLFYISDVSFVFKGTTPIYKTLVFQTIYNTYDNYITKLQKRLNSKKSISDRQKLFLQNFTITLINDYCVPYNGCKPKYEKIDNYTLKNNKTLPIRRQFNRTMEIREYNKFKKNKTISKKNKINFIKNA